MLTVKQEKFCIAYLETGNASEAYRQAYDTSKMNGDSVNRKAHDLAKNVKIEARMAELMKPLHDKLEISQKKTLTRLMQGQEFDIRRLYREDGTLKHPHELDDDTARAIVGVKYDRDGALLEYKVIDVKGCAELVGKHLKLFTDKTEVDMTGNVTLVMSKEDAAL